MKIDCAHDSLVDVDKLLLIQNPKNNNKHSKEQIERLAKIIDFQGQRHPIVVSNRSGFITKGHGRLMAIHKLGWKQAAVDYQDYISEAQEYADMTADNEIARWAEFDSEKFLNDIKEIDLGDIELLGLKEIPELLTEKEGLTDPDDVPEVAQNIHNVQLGQIWKLGEHRLMCGDSTDLPTIEKLMNGEKADMVFTDPPYGVGYKYNSHNDDVSKEQHTQFLDRLIKQALEISGKFILTPGCNNLDTVFSISKPNHVGCWTKTNAMSPGRITHFWTWEPIFFFGKWKRKRGNDCFNYPVGKQPDTADHTCPKPLLLWIDIVENFSENNETILDLFGGSGSTLIACEKTNRKCFMMELDPHYCSVIIERWQNFTGKKAELLNG